MKRLILPLLLALGACSPQPPAAPPAAAVAGPDPSLGGARAGTWVRAEGERNGGPMVWTYREDYVPDATHPRLLVISQGVESTAASKSVPGLEQELSQREQTLREGLKGKAELVAVLDWNQQHDWFFYATPELSGDEVAALLGKPLQADIRTTLEDDAEFAFYRTLRKRVSEAH